MHSSTCLATDQHEARLILTTTDELEQQTAVAAMKTQSTVRRFDPALCGKVVRIAAAACLVEFLATMALWMMWVPADSKCRAWVVGEGPPKTIFLIIAAVLTLWTCIIAIFWKHFANLVFAQVRWEDRLRSSTGWFAVPYPFGVNHTLLISVVMSGFAAIVAMTLIFILRKCGP